MQHTTFPAGQTPPSLQTGRSGCDCTPPAAGARERGARGLKPRLPVARSSAPAPARPARGPRGLHTGMKQVTAERPVFPAGSTTCGSERTSRVTLVGEAPPRLEGACKRGPVESSDSEAFLGLAHRDSVKATSVSASRASPRTPLHVFSILTPTPQTLYLSGLNVSSLDPRLSESAWILILPENFATQLWGALPQAAQVAGISPAWGVRRASGGRGGSRKRRTA